MSDACIYCPECRKFTAHSNTGVDYVCGVCGLSRYEEPFVSANTGSTEIEPSENPVT